MASGIGERGVTQLVDYQVADGIALVGLRHPPANALNHELRRGLREAIDRAVADPAVRAIVVTGTGTMFSSGADIQEFGTDAVSREPDLPWLCDHLEACPKLLIMALNGIAMGGGLELALVGDYRIAAATAKLSLPEATLGLIPGAGGTQRLPRRIDPKVALDLIVTGRQVSAERALELGLVDEVVATGNEFQPRAVAYARSLVAREAPRRRCAEAALGPAALPVEFVAEYRQSLARRTRGLFAPAQGIRAVEAARDQPLREGLQLERKLFQDCLATPQHRAQRHLFFAERAAKKVPGVGRDTPPREVRRVGIVGSGTMGSGIATAFLAAGMKVTLLDVTSEALERGVDRIKDNQERAIGGKRLSREDADAQMTLLATSTRYDDIADVDLVIEAVLEDLALKQRVFAELDRVCRPGCVLASNTSTLDLDRIAAATTRPQDVVGLHFFSPANVMRLLEVVRGAKTSPDVLATALDLGRKIGKLPVVVGVCFGFVGNRMAEPYVREAQRLLLEGATPAQVDRALTDFGMAMGPLAVIDLAGLDVTFLIRESRREAIAQDASYAIVGDELYRMGRFGQKTGRGFFIYDGRERRDDPEMVDLAQGLAGRLGIARRTISDDEIVERCIYSMVDEGSRILEEGIATRAGDCDLIQTNGFGFPVWRGGPMHYAGEIGLDAVCASLDRYRDALDGYGAMWFKPSGLMRKLAASRQSFSNHEAASET